jgi:membrane-bound serine protease (ClpP class)
MKHKLIILTGLAIFLVLFLNSAWAGKNDIYIIEVVDAISPGVAEFIKDGIETAEKEGAACIIIALDTPGGLAESMRMIIQNILGSKVPVVVYVSPAGARAASAGVMITMAADIAAMAPGTNIGAAHPVGAGGKDISGKMSEKVINDMVAHAKSVAKERGRNEKWVEEAIRESVSVTETEALEENIIDLIAKDTDDLIQQLKYILLMIGLAGLYFELSHPGAIFPGVIGGISLVLAFFALQTLPVNYAGLLLIVLAIIFFIMEMKITSYGLLSVAGIISLLLGSLMMFKGTGPDLKLSWRVLLPTLILVSGFFVFVAGLVFRAQISKPKTGSKGLVGEIGVVKKALTPEGKVFVHGELWNAKSEKEIAEDIKVRVVNVVNFTLEVEPVENRSST